MLSPKMQHRMQRSVRINDGQLLGLAEKARYDSRLSGFLHKRCSDSNKWLLRWFRLYQNLLFYYDTEQSVRPIGIIFLEGCYCERVLSASATKADREEEKMHCFAIMYRRDNQRQYEMRATSTSECQSWIEAIKMASFNKLHLLMEELEQKHLHLLQVVESEKTAKWQYTQHCEELTEEIKKLRNELNALKKEWRLLPQMSKSTTSSQDSDRSDENAEDPDIAKIKKVQSFFRGWLCRRRWKQIVDEYIRSPHAESMRKRNCLVFRMVESEEEYVDQLEILISCFLRPFKMAASSKNPPCTHEDINSIFLNSETVLFLHQIFLKGLTARMESWPTLVLGTSLGDLFDMLLPMLTIYQEYVRNHHYSLQVLTECKQGPMFASLLSRLEKKPACKGRSLETFLTYPMHQIPRYIITLHELLAHTPPDHVEKKSLENARDQLEDLSRQMHDEVSETENIRKNLAIERMIVEGCDILLDVNQIFVRQGTLVQIMAPGQRGTTRARSIFGHDKEREEIRQCFLFSNHLIITSRNQSGGRLHLVEGVGKIPLADITLIEDPNEEDRTDNETSSTSSTESLSDLSSVSNEHKALDFKLMVDDVKSGQQITVHLVAPTRQEKAAWITDISQCMDNVHFNGLFYNTMPNASSSTIPQCVKSDPNLFKDDAEIRFSKTFNNCKIPQIRYATPERLLERLTDLRFLNIDFLNTFLLTYRVFTDAITVLEALKKVFFNPEPPDSPTSSTGSVENLHQMNPNQHRPSCGGFSLCGGIPPVICHETSHLLQTGSPAAGPAVSLPCGEQVRHGHHSHHSDGKRRISTCSGYSTATENAPRHGSLTPSSRRISGASSISGYYSDERERHSFSHESTGNYLLQGSHQKTQHWRYSFRKYEEEQRESANNNSGNGGGGGGAEALGVPSPRRSTNSSSSKNSAGPAERRKGSHDSRSGSIVSTSGNMPNWQRKESVTIVERAEDERDAEDETEAEMVFHKSAIEPVSCLAAYRRASSAGEHSEDNFLTVPKSITASSSAETLTETSSGPPTPTNLTKVISASSISQTTVVAVRVASGSRSSSGGGNSTSEQLSLDKEDDEIAEELKHDEELPMENVEDILKVEPEELDDVMSKMKKDPEQETFQPIKKKFGPETQDIRRGLTGGSAPQQPCSILKHEHPYRGQKKASLPTLPSHALCSSASTGRCRTRSTSTFSTASSASACLAAAFHHTHHHRGHHSHHHHAKEAGGGDGSDMICMMGSSRSQPCSHHPSFSGSTAGKSIFGGLSFKDLTSGIKSPTKEMKKRKGLFSSAGSSANSRCGEDTSAACGNSPPLSSPQHSKMGVVITSSRQAHRRSSSASAAVAFAVATAGSGNPPDFPTRGKETFQEAAKRKCSITSNVSTMRVVSVLRHWVTKHSQDFETNQRLKNLTIEFLEDIICTPTLLPSEHRASSQLLRMLTKEEPAQNLVDLDTLLVPTEACTKDSIMTLSALEIAEQMTWLDQKILFSIMSSEFLGQAWTKPDKSTRAPKICLITKRFNDMSRLVVAEIITQPCMTTRVQCIEKWAAVADICKCLHNFNGVLQICSALTNSSVYRLRNTWNRVSKSSRQTVEKLQNLVSSDGRFRNLRDSLHRTDPPCIPYLGMYLSDLTFIEEGTPNFTDNGLLNFAKMRMIAHVVREIRQFQQTPYKIEKIQKVLNYLLDTSRQLDDEELYQRSLIVEPRTSRLSSSFGHGFATASVTMAVAAAAAAAAANQSAQASKR